MKDIKPFVRMKCLLVFLLVAPFFINEMSAQDLPSENEWIRLESSTSPAAGVRKGGIVLSLWPTSVSNPQGNGIGSPRALLNVGYNFKGHTYLINYMAIEPVVNGKQEFSEISPSRVDGKLGKLIWAGSNIQHNR